MLKDKLWGQTRCIHVDRHTELHHASIHAGGYSSRHSHTYKHNLFYVLSGELKVHRYDPDEPPVVLRAGEAYTAPAGRDHRFEAVAAVELIELYWPVHGADLDPDDIVRLDIGGLAADDPAVRTSP